MRIVDGLRKEYPNVSCALKHEGAFQLLIATILSAQCTDARVNMVTPKLFEKYKTAAEFSKAKVEDLERAIHSTGFFRSKAKNIKATCQRLLKEFGSEVPRTMDELLSLPGVARKTANVVLGSAFGLTSGIVVDTHVFRLSHRLGLTEAKSAEKVEQDLMAVIPKTELINFSHRLIHHGRKVCVARKPQCDRCVLLTDCPRLGVDAISRVP